MNSLNDFTNLYSLSKTLRFELKPIGKTKATFDEWIKEIQEGVENGDNFLLKDEKIYKAYVSMKYVLDYIHEDFINHSLNSEVAKSIDWSQYFEAYKGKTDGINDNENKLRAEIGKTFFEGVRYIKENLKGIEVGKGKNKKNLDFKEKSYKCLGEDKMLNYINVKADSLAKHLEKTKDEIEEQTKILKGFWGYFSKYVENRNNYYKTDKEQSTAIATRIVHENLPTFCDNILRFEKYKGQYVSMKKWLNENGKNTQIKNAQTGKFQDVTEICAENFEINHFSDCLTQAGIDAYNVLMGNYNMLVNLYNQARKDESGFKKLPEFERLKKQIGCGEKKSLFAQLIADKEKDLGDKKNEKEIQSVEKLLRTAKDAGERIFRKQGESASIDTVPAFIDWLKTCDDWKGVYWSKGAVNRISNIYFANWHTIKDKFKSKKSSATFDKKREEQVKLRDAVELSDLFAILDEEKLDFVFKESVLKEYEAVIDPNGPARKDLINMICADMERNMKTFLDNADAIVGLKKYKDENTDDEDKIVKQIKDWFDASNDIMRTIRYFAVPKSKMKGNMANPTMEQALYNLLYNNDADWSKWYDMIRNYLTKKPQDDVKKDKIKLNFNSSSLLKGWSVGEEKVKLSVMLKKDGLYYLCILKDKKLFEMIDSNEIYKPNGGAERMCIRNLGFKTLTGKGYKGMFNVKYSEETDNRLKISRVKKYIKESDNKYLHKYPDLKCAIEKEYGDDIESFKKEVTQVLSKYCQCSFVPIDWKKLQEHENAGELFLFQISSKDFKEKSTGNKDLQTIYWEDLFTKNSSHRIAANGEIFTRQPVAKESKICHSVGQKLVDKKDVDGNSIPEKIYKEVFDYVNKRTKILSKEAKSLLDSDKIKVKDVKYKIEKDRRFYGENKYFFHCPILLNYAAKAYKDLNSAYPEVNEKINDAVQKTSDLSFIGIDRGEKHLVYSCTIDKKGAIVDCKHHDNINGTDYVRKLTEKANERTESRKNWQTQSKIADLKDGYISHVVHSLVEETIKDKNGRVNPHSYIVLEDLNKEMKRGRQKFEQQVYQKFETALAKKLNFVVDKSAKPDEFGSVGHALQLTPPVNNYQDIENKKQFGIMLYTRANYTSITDPLTGWRKTIYIKNGNDADIKEQIMEKFSDFGFDGKDYFFEYTEPHANKKWKLYSGTNGKSLLRFRNKPQMKEDKNVWIPEEISVVEILDELFAGFDKKKSFKKQIESGKDLSEVSGSSLTAWQSLRYVLDLIQQIRNSGGTEDDDNFLLSPVRDGEGRHFDTRKSKEFKGLEKIVDADANGAYNIARKGLIMDEHIKTWISNGKPKNKDNKKEVSDLNLFISDEEWDMWLLDRNMWKENLQKFASRKQMFG